MVTEDLIERVKAGDEHAFRQLVGPYQGELQLHCYRILGSAQDAEDALQETLLAAWRGLARFEGRSSVRTWLYRVATNTCLKALRSASRRPPANWPPPGVEIPKPSRVGEVIWLQPYPDMLLEGLADATPGPEARYEASEAISLAFVTALQALPPRQRAVSRCFHGCDVVAPKQGLVPSVARSESSLVPLTFSFTRGGPPPAQSVL